MSGLVSIVTGLGSRLVSATITIVVAGIAVVVFSLVSEGCSGPPLKPWLIKALTEEFTAQHSEEIRSFDDYRKLEDRLFAELDEKIYAGSEAGPADALVRYRRGSAADPSGRSPNWNRSFEFTADAPVGGVLLLHGMSDSPYSLRALGETFKKNNYWVLGLRLPGHGTAPSGLKSVQWQDMAAAVRLSMSHLASKVGQKPIHIVGYSTGAPLAVHFSLNALDGEVSPVPASLILISPASGIHALAALANWKARLANIPGLGKLAWLQTQPEFDPYKYNSFATNAGGQVHDLTNAVASRVAARAQSHPNDVLPPTLVFKSTVDATVSIDAVVDKLLGNLAPHRHELVLFDINRSAVKSSLLIADPAPFTRRLMTSSTLPFAVTLVTNERSDSASVEARQKPAFSRDVSSKMALNLAWPAGVISLSHVALPFPPDDPLYGQIAPTDDDVLFLGQIAIQGERGLLQFPADWLMRLRHNPFYSFLEMRALAWVNAAQTK